MPTSPDLYRRPQYVIPVETHKILSEPTDSTDIRTLVASTGDSPKRTHEEDYFRTSVLHGRSICRELDHENYLLDSHKFLYTIYSIKGTILTEILAPEQDPPDPQNHAEALLALWPRGLIEQKDENNVTNVIHASSAIRASGLVTEYAQSVCVMDSVIIDGHRIHLHDQLTKLARHRRAWLTAHPLMKKAKQEVLQTVLDKYEEKMNSVRLYIIERYLPVAERLEDIFYSRTIEEVIERLTPSERWTRHQRITHREISEFPQIVSKSHLQHYFQYWLPAQMGTYIGRIHKQDSVHGGTHAQNWMPIGALADCDSTKGKLVSNNSPTDAEIQKDIDDAIGVFVQMNDSGIIWEIFDYHYDPEVLSETFYRYYLQV